jgi:hypothetical protein
MVTYSHAAKNKEHRRTCIYGRADAFSHRAFIVAWHYVADSIETPSDLLKTAMSQPVQTLCFGNKVLKQTARVRSQVNLARHFSNGSESLFVTRSGFTDVVICCRDVEPDRTQNGLNRRPHKRKCASIVSPRCKQHEHRIDVFERE